jgi:hypothetical protein
MTGLPPAGVSCALDSACLDVFRISRFGNSTRDHKRRWPSTISATVQRGTAPANGDSEGWNGHLVERAIEPGRSEWGSWWVPAW